MGYTHYWTVEGDLDLPVWKEICSDARKLIEVFQSTIKSFQVDDEVIAVNSDCESFVLTRTASELRSCKTFHDPVDKLICAILSVASQYTPGLQISSDAEMGSRPDGWPAAAVWAGLVLRYKVNPPWPYSGAKEPIGLDPDAEAVLFEPNDWRECDENVGLMHHLPTKAAFVIDIPNKQANDVVTIMDFRAFLVDDPDTEAERDEIVALGRAAIAVYLIDRGYWNPVVREVPDEPKPRTGFGRGPELS